MAHKYKTKVPEIHCSGCVNLIKMTLEDEFDSVNVDQDKKEVTFTTELDAENTVNTLNRLFEELKPHGYTYIELEQVDG